MNFLKVIAILVTYVTIIDSNRIGTSQVQSVDQEKTWYNNLWDIVSSIGKNFKEFPESKIDSLKRPKTRMRHICIWKICSKPLRNSMKTSIEKVNSIRYHNKILNSYINQYTY